MKKFLLLLIIFSVSIFPQFNPTHKSLVKTTFKREFDKKIVNTHLSSKNENDVIAALLAISHSEDQNFIQQITKLDFDKFGKYISFALGQLGVSPISESYLLSKITNSKHIDDILIALGKCGDKKSFEFIKKNAKELKLINSRGFYIAFYNYMLNKHTLTDKEKTELILNNISEDKDVLAAQLFSLARTGVEKTDCTNLVPMLSSLEDPELVVGVISVLRRSPFVPKSINEFDKLSKEDWRVRTELVRLNSRIQFSTEAELENFFKNLTDKNGNVSRQTAALAGNLQIDKNLEKKCEALCYSYLWKNLEKNTANELLTSLAKRFKEQIPALLEKHSSKISLAAYFNILKMYDKNSKEKLELLSLKNKDLTNSEYLSYTDALLSLQDKLDSDKYTESVFTVLRSSNAPAIFIASTGLDSVFVEKHSNELEKITKNIFTEKINDAHFSEALSGILTLAEKISDKYYNFCLEKLLSSTLTENQNIVKKAKELPLVKRSDDELFETIWNNAFKYKAAKVITEKGEFVIKFKPEFAPLSVGNFITLTEKKYFDNVIFHRVVSNFVIQTGDPSGTGWGGPGYSICSEFSPLEYVKGAVGMASSGKDTEGSQWYVMHSHFPHLNRRYTNFGIVENDFETVNNVLQGDKIKSIELLK